MAHPPAPDRVPLAPEAASPVGAPSAAPSPVRAPRQYGEEDCSIQVRRPCLAFPHPCEGVGAAPAAGNIEDLQPADLFGQMRVDDEMLANRFQAEQHPE